jgi:glutaredoxin-related protein
MGRPLLNEENIAQEALGEIANFHMDIVKEVSETVAKNKVVIVGMAQNPVVKKARKALDEAGVSHQYLEYGSYLSKWKERLAIKLWSGWPTYPQVFVDGKLIGGCKETIELLKSGKIKK